MCTAGAHAPPHTLTNASYGPSVQNSQWQSEDKNMSSVPLLIASTREDTVAKRCS